MIQIQALTSFEDDQDSIRKGQIFYRGSYKAHDLEKRGLVIILNGDPILAPGAPLPALPVAPVSPAPIVSSSASGVTKAGKKKTSKSKQESS